MDITTLVKPLLELGSNGVLIALLWYMVAYAIPRRELSAREDLKEAWAEVGRLRDQLEKAMDLLKK